MKLFEAWAGFPAALVINASELHSICQNPKFNKSTRDYFIELEKEAQRRCKDMDIQLHRLLLVFEQGSTAVSFQVD